MTERLAAVVRGTREPGVYRWRSSAHPAALRRDLASAGWALYPVDGGTLTCPDDLFDTLAYRLAFPAWFGRTWEALAHCLADLSWLPGRGHIVLWERHGALARADEQAWRQMYAVCAAAIAARERSGAPPLYVLLRGPGPADPPLL